MPVEFTSTDVGAVMIGVEADAVMATSAVDVVVPQLVIVTDRWTFPLDAAVKVAVDVDPPLVMVPPVADHT